MSRYRKTITSGNGNFPDISIISDTWLSLKKYEGSKMKSKRRNIRRHTEKLRRHPENFFPQWKNIILRVLLSGRVIGGGGKALDEHVERDPRVGCRLGVVSKTLDKVSAIYFTDRPIFSNQSPLLLWKRLWNGKFDHQSTEIHVGFFGLGYFKISFVLLNYFSIFEPRQI